MQRIASVVVGCLVVAAVGSAATVAQAAPKATVSSAKVVPGQAVLVTVSGAGKSAPDGKVGDQTLSFYATKTGYQAVFAVPVDTKPGAWIVKVDGAKDVTVTVAEKTFGETSVIVEEEMANPGPEDRKTIDADNAAILAAARKADETPQFTGVFKKPAGKVTSPFGEWRTFNDGHRSQHLGVDMGAAEGSKVKAINSGTVVLVRSTFLAGNVVVVAHGGGIASAYYHLSEAKVAEGATIAIGDVVGLAGHTGRTTGPHLHLSVRVPGGFVDPVSFFGLKVAPVRSIRPVH